MTLVQISADAIVEIPKKSIANSVFIMCSPVFVNYLRGPGPGLRGSDPGSCLGGSLGSRGCG